MNIACTEKIMRIQSSTYSTKPTDNIDVRSYTFIYFAQKKISKNEPKTQSNPKLHFWYTQKSGLGSNQLNKQV